MPTKILAVTSLSLLASLLWLSTAAAHIMVESSDRSAALVFHVTPDDSPIAGQSSSLFFDIRKSNSSAVSGIDIVALQVLRPDGETVYVPAEVKGMYISAQYTFDTQGIYSLQLEVGAGDDSESFHIVQRVSRGVVGEEAALAKKHRWAELLLVGSSVTGGMLVILAVVRRKQIIAVSR